jgi:hypothetical protein
MLNTPKIELKQSATVAPTRLRKFCPLGAARGVVPRFLVCCRLQESRVGALKDRDCRTGRATCQQFNRSAKIFYRQFCYAVEVRNVMDFRDRGFWRDSRGDVGFCTLQEGIFCRSRVSDQILMENGC